VGALRKTASFEEAITLFKTQEIVWVTKTEDAKLPRINRPDSDRVYTEAKIEIVRNPNKIGHLFGFTE